jgi:hypothetical protein
MPFEPFLYELLCVATCQAEKAMGEDATLPAVVKSALDIGRQTRTHFDSLPRGAYNTALGSSDSVENRRGGRRFAKERKAR